MRQENLLNGLPIAFPILERTMKLTQSIANKLTLPPGKSDAIYFDDDVHGLGLRVRSGGKRSWVFQYGIGTKQRRMSLGTAPALSLAAARKTATELHAKVRLGEKTRQLPKAKASGARRTPLKPFCGSTYRKRDKPWCRAAIGAWNGIF
jgi:hypothetical protein